jgi:anti-anti-sigma factor
MISGMDPARTRPQLLVSQSTQAGAQVIELTGELGLESVYDLDEALATVDLADRVCLDLAGVDFMDSTGLSGIVRAHQSAEESGGMLLIVAPGGIARRSLEISGLLSLLHVFDDRAAALSSPGRTPPHR